ncbi:hypothetical protein BaRGS_00027520, partial [Batillaria attramentaria]
VRRMRTRRYRERLKQNPQKYALYREKDRASSATKRLTAKAVESRRYRERLKQHPERYERTKERDRLRCRRNYWKKKMAPRPTTDTAEMWKLNSD